MVLNVRPKLMELLGKALKFSKDDLDLFIALFKKHSGVNLDRSVADLYAKEIISYITLITVKTVKGESHK